MTILRDGAVHIQAPSGIRLITDTAGKLEGIVGMSVRTVTGMLHYDGRSIAVEIKGNEQQRYQDGILTTERDIGIIYPTYR
jgi:hypothetical protein